LEEVERKDRMTLPGLLDRPGIELDNLIRG